MRNNPEVVITHHTGGTDANPRADSSNATVRNVDSWHKQRWPGFVSRLGYHVGYHYFIDKDGKVTQTREHDEEGAHCIGMNRRSIGVCFAGNFDVRRPTPKQIVAWDRLYSRLKKEFPGITTQPHRKYATKSCHGSLLSDTFFASEDNTTALVERLEQLILQLASLLSGKRM